LVPDSLVPGAQLLQYLFFPDGLLLNNETNEFGFPIEEQVNMIRIDIIKPNSTGSFYDRAFSLIPSHIAGNVPIPNWQDGHVVPSTGTQSQWIQVTADISAMVSNPGTYALRVSSAQSIIGVSWGISNVHITATGGLKRTTPAEQVRSFRKRNLSVEPVSVIESKVIVSKGKTLKK